MVAGAVGVGLSAWWLLPFATGQAYTTNMGYTKVLGFPHLLFPASARWVLAADLVGAGGHGGPAQPGGACSSW